MESHVQSTFAEKSSSNEKSTSDTTPPRCEVNQDSERPTSPDVSSSITLPLSDSSCILLPPNEKDNVLVTPTTTISNKSSSSTEKSTSGVIPSKCEVNQDSEVPTLPNDSSSITLALADSNCILLPSNAKDNALSNSNTNINDKSLLTPLSPTNEDPKAPILISNVINNSEGVTELIGMDESISSKICNLESNLDDGLNKENVQISVVTVSEKIEEGEDGSDASHTNVGTVTNEEEESIHRLGDGESPEANEEKGNKTHKAIGLTDHSVSDAVTELVQANDPPQNEEVLPILNQGVSESLEANEEIEGKTPKGTGVTDAVTELVEVNDPPQNEKILPILNQGDNESLEANGENMGKSHKATGVPDRSMTDAVTELVEASDPPRSEEILTTLNHEINKGNCEEVLNKESDDEAQILKLVEGKEISGSNNSLLGGEQEEKSSCKSTLLEDEGSALNVDSGDEYHISVVADIQEETRNDNEENLNSSVSEVVASKSNEAGSIELLNVDCDDETEDDLMIVDGGVEDHSISEPESSKDYGKKNETMVDSTIQDQSMDVDEGAATSVDVGCDSLDDSGVNTSGSQVECINPQCESGTYLSIAPVAVLTYYGVHRRKNTLQRVCLQCYTLAEHHNLKLINMARNREVLLTAKFPSVPKIDVVTMDVVEELYEEEPLPKEITEMVEDNLMDVIEKVFDSHDINYQLEQSIPLLTKEYDSIQESEASLYEEFKMLEKRLTEMRKEVYEGFVAPIRHLRPVDITQPGATFPYLDKKLKFTPKPPPGKKLTPSYLLPPSIVIPTASDLQKSTLPNSKSTASAISPVELTDVVAVGVFQGSLQNRPVGPLKRIPLIVGDKVFMPRAAPEGVWLKGEVVEIRDKLHSVKYNGMIKHGLSLKNLAYSTPSEVTYPLASRVVAEFTTMSNPKRGAFYVGVIAEPHKVLNKQRYLVFFDDGYAQYVKHDRIFAVCESSSNVWEDVNIHSREFIQEYFTNYPERPMVRLQPGQQIRLQYLDKWLPAKVEEIDCSLAKITLMWEKKTQSLSEWMYRGSTRLKPLYDEVVKKTRSLGTGFLSKRNMPYVEYNRDQDQSSRNVAKKSTAGRPSDNYVEKSNLDPRMYDRLEFPTKGYLRQMDLRNRVKSRPLIDHTCGPPCVRVLRPPSFDRRKIPPLVYPLLIGFTRLFFKKKGKRCVIYCAPCGRKLRHMEDMRCYLRTTKCQLGIDYFDFDHWVRVIEEFHLEPSMYKTHVEDISDGVENMAVSCVNEIHTNWPEMMKYATQRIPQDGVNLNTDPNFMICCDCTDDCANKKECACWQLTIEGTRTGPNNVPDDTIGYQFKRLPEAVTTGIYECHSGCSCFKTCLNRVVQHPLNQRLQVFRTLRKGWGLRTLNDIPTGSFVCVYVGKLHTEASANEGGRMYGDEYLAELDYIEVVEQFKEGYEEEAANDTDPIEDEEEEEEDELEEANSWGKSQEKDFEYTPEQYVEARHRQVNTRSVLSKKRDDDEEEGGPMRKPSKFSANVQDKSEEKKTEKSARELFGDSSDEVYIMDAKNEGNIGRYLNHSCQPNIFVQNVFVDTHDLRFPWIAFFAMSHIRAGTELTWDYNYNIGSVPNKVLYCYCNSSDCRGRLL